MTSETATQPRAQNKTQVMVVAVIFDEERLVFSCLISLLVKSKITIVYVTEQR